MSECGSREAREVLQEAAILRIGQTLLEIELVIVRPRELVPLVRDGLRHARAVRECSGRNLTKKGCRFLYVPWVNQALERLEREPMCGGDRRERLGRDEGGELPPPVRTMPWRLPTKEHEDGLLWARLVSHELIILPTALTQKVAHGRPFCVEQLTSRLKRVRKAGDALFKSETCEIG